jgi:excinuclease UvrABC nuclease subunit
MLEGFVDVSAILSAGVYALVRDGVVVYVGQSKRMLSRVSAHKSNWGKKNQPAWLPPSVRGILFDAVHVLPCRVEDLDLIEARMIQLYKPRYNIKIKSPDPVVIAHLFAKSPPIPFPRRI